MYMQEEVVKYIKLKKRELKIILIKQIIKNYQKFRKKQKKSKKFTQTKAKRVSLSERPQVKNSRL